MCSPSQPPSLIGDNVLLEHLNIYEWVIIILLPLTVGSVIKTWLVCKENSLLADELSTTKHCLEQLENDWTELKKEHDRVKEFQNSLDEAELTTRLQQPRLTAEETARSGNTPEKYRYIRSLHEKGMGSVEIASILGISTQEAEQLVTLAKIAREK